MSRRREHEGTKSRDAVLPSGSREPARARLVRASRATAIGTIVGLAAALGATVIAVGCDQPPWTGDPTLQYSTGGAAGEGGGATAVGGAGGGLGGLGGSATGGAPGGGPSGGGGSGGAGAPGGSGGNGGNAGGGGQGGG
jgi:hypothetical protein